jgi:DNA-binding NarL/FixJ family response regulator
VIRVAVVDDHPLVRVGFGVLIRSCQDLEFVGEAADGHDAVELARAEHPDVMLMDVRMPGLNGIDATRLITTDPATASTRVLVLTTFDLDEYAYGALRAGASGFLLKDTAPDELLDAIRVVAGGDSLLAPTTTRRLIAEFVRRVPAESEPLPDLAQLTDRETEVLVAVARGRSNSEIAHELFMSYATAKTHVSRLLTKLDARDRAQLVVIAYETGLIRRGAPDVRNS